MPPCCPKGLAVTVPAVREASACCRALPDVSGREAASTDGTT